MKFRSCPAQRILTKVSIFDPGHDQGDCSNMVLLNILFSLIKKGFIWSNFIMKE